MLAHLIPMELTISAMAIILMKHIIVEKLIVTGYMMFAITLVIIGINITVICAPERGTGTLLIPKVILIEIFMKLQTHVTIHDKNLEHIEESRN